MPNDVVIQVEGLSKQYRLGEITTGTLAHDLNRWWARVRGRPDPTLKVTATNTRDRCPEPAEQGVDGGRTGGGPKASGTIAQRSGISAPRTSDYVWALHDINFEVKRGEVLGIIGRNGAGKSTLLKILSRVTAPTEGSVRIKGSSASLLEVGTGFHPELTGRENIYLNGAILGMTKAEVTGKLEEIVEFSGCARYIDTPVKRYSSGMLVRLGFAVAAHLEPEILIVDEVLAVGDAEFQKRCIAKMEDVSKEHGRTVLLVSHSMTTMQALCEKVLYLDDGLGYGPMEVHEGVQRYLGGQEQGRGCFAVPESSQQDKRAYITGARLLDERGTVTTRVPTCAPLFVEMSWVNRDGVPVNANIMMVNHNTVSVMIAFDTTVDWDGRKKMAQGAYVSRVKIPANLLNSGDYAIHVALDCPAPRVNYCHYLDALHFTVWDPMDQRCLSRGAYTHVRDDAVLWPALEWEWERLSTTQV